MMNNRRVFEKKKKPGNFSCSQKAQATHFNCQVQISGGLKSFSEISLTFKYYYNLKRLSKFRKTRFQEMIIIFESLKNELYLGRRQKLGCIIMNVR